MYHIYFFISITGTSTTQSKIATDVKPKEIKWSKYTPTELRTPVSIPLKRKRKEEGTLRTKLGEWAMSKKKVAIASETHVTEENTLKLQFLKEAHVEKLNREKEKHELQIEHLKEIHNLEITRKKLEIEILAVQKNKLL